MPDPAGTGPADPAESLFVSHLSGDRFIEEIRAARQARQRAAVLRRRRLLVAVTALALVGGSTAVAVAFPDDDRRREPAAGPERAAKPGTPSTPPPSSAAAESLVEIAGVGDVILGAAPTLPPNNGATFFDGVRGELTGDVVMGNLESPLTDDTGHRKCKPPPTPSAAPTPRPKPSPKTCFAFRAPPSYAPALKNAGFTVLSLANNHANDYGAAGLSNTRRALEQQGLEYTGGPNEVAVVRAGEVTVAVIGVAPYPWAQSLIDIADAQRLVRAAANQADIVVVNMHAGAEGADQTHVRPGKETFLGENRGNPIAFAHAVVDAGADLVVGHSPHVLRGMEFYRGRLIAYSMGNFAGYRVLRRTGALGIGGILKVTLAGDGSWRSGTLVPTLLAERGLPVTDPAGQAITLVDGLSVADFRATAVRVEPDGTLRVPDATPADGPASPGPSPAG